MVNVLKTEKFLFGFLLFTLFWLPLSLGANRPWAWALMQMSVFFIGGMLVIIRVSLLSQLYTRYKLFVILWLAFLGWQLINIVPLPLSLVEVIRPERVSHLLGNGLGFQENVTSMWLSLSLTSVKAMSPFLSPLLIVFYFLSR